MSKALQSTCKTCLQVHCYALNEAWVPCLSLHIPDFGVGPKLHHVITAKSVLAPLFPVVGADGLPIEESSVQAASVCDLPAALTGLPSDDHMPSGHLSIGKGQGVVFQPAHCHLHT